MNTPALQQKVSPESQIELSFNQDNYIIFDLVDKTENALRLVGGLSILCHNLSLIPNTHLIYITSRQPIQIQKHLDKYSFVRKKQIAFIHCTKGNTFIDQISNFNDKILLSFLVIQFYQSIIIQIITIQKILVVIEKGVKYGWISKKLF